MWTLRQLDADSLLAKLRGFELETTRVRGELVAWWTAGTWFRRMTVRRC